VEHDALPAPDPIATAVAAPPTDVLEPPPLRVRLPLRFRSQARRRPEPLFPQLEEPELDPEPEPEAPAATEEAPSLPPDLIEPTADEPESQEPEPAAPALEETPTEPGPARRWPWQRPGRRLDPVETFQPPAPPEPPEADPLRLEAAVRHCATCGRPISRERLRAIPDASQCIECKREGLPLPETEVLEPLPEPEIAPEPDDAPEPELPEPEPAEPEPEPEFSPEVPTAVEPDPEPEPLPVQPLAVVPPPPPLPPPSPLREPFPPPQRLSALPREWNLWELEQLARGRAGMNAHRDEEWGFLLIYLRDFAGPDGRLPLDFDLLVRESFAELLDPAPSP